MSDPGQTEAGGIQAAHEMVEGDAGHIQVSGMGRVDLGVGNLDPATGDTGLEAVGDIQAVHGEAEEDIQAVLGEAEEDIQAEGSLLLLDK